MAQLDLSKAKKVEKSITKIHQKVPFTYTIFEHFGTKYFQIDTYGTRQRVRVDQISQSLQLDEETAEFLIRELINAFDFDFQA